MFRTYSNQMTAHYHQFTTEDAPTLTSEQTREFLAKVEQKINAPDRWTKLAAMLDADGNEISPLHVSEHAKAVCWCLGEAIQQVSLTEKFYCSTEIDEIICDSIIDLFGFEYAARKLDMQTYADPDHDRELLLSDNIFRFNDYHHTTHAEIIQVLQHAQKAA